jgi:hypothetical protein
MAADAKFGIEPDDDPDFDEELFARDPVFTRATQAEIRRRIANAKAGNLVFHDLIEMEN